MVRDSFVGDVASSGVSDVPLFGQLDKSVMVPGDSICINSPFPLIVGGVICDVSFDPWFMCFATGVDIDDVGIDIL